MSDNLQSKGTPIESLPGARMVYNDTPGQRGVEVHTESEIVMFGGRAALEEFAHKNQLSEQDLLALQRLDAQADAHRTKPSYPEFAQSQDQIDREALRGIDDRSEQRALHAPHASPEADQRMALTDAQAFQRIQNPAWQESAAVVMANNTREYPDYKAELEKASPDVAAKVQSLDSAHEAKVSAKEDFKTAEYTDATGLSVDDLARVAVARARDTAQAKESLGLNSLEGRQANTSSTGNEVESDEVFTASHADAEKAIPSDIEKQYLRVGDKFYDRRDSQNPAFEDKGNRLETQSSSEAVAESLVRIAEARGWDEIKVSGSETFKKEVWLEAASRGMHVKGYSPTEQDKVELAKRLEKSETNKVEKDYQSEASKSQAEDNDKRKDMARSFEKDPPETAVKKHPELAATVAAAQAINMHTQNAGFTAAQQKIIMDKVRENAVNSIERGQAAQISIQETRQAEFTQEATR